MANTNQKEGTITSVPAYVLIGALAGIGLMIVPTDEKPKTFLSAQINYAETSPEVEDPKLWSGKDLWEMAKIYEQQADDFRWKPCD